MKRLFIAITITLLAIGSFSCSEEEIKPSTVDQMPDGKKVEDKQGF